MADNMRDLTDEERDEALRIVNMLEVRDAADDLDRASAWIAISTDSEFGTTVITGPFVNPGDALGYALRWEKELNIGGDPDLPYTVAVKPIFEPEEMLR